jgi:hypothetical protein
MMVLAVVSILLLVLAGLIKMGVIVSGVNEYLLIIVAIVLLGFLLSIVGIVTLYSEQVANFFLS